MTTPDKAPDAKPAAKTAAKDERIEAFGLDGDNPRRDYTDLAEAQFAADHLGGIIEHVGVSFHVADSDE